MSENYKPTSGMASAARRALQWKKEGRRGGTRVGLARANQLVNREPLSESTVMRMYSFFSRHEVDKKAEGFNSGENGFPSPGRVAWDLWGGDAGASWSKQKRNQIMNDRMKKSIWAGVFFPVDEPTLQEDDSPLPDQIEDIVIPEEVAEVAVSQESVVSETVVEEESSEEVVSESSESEEAVEVEEVIAEAEPEAQAETVEETTEDPAPVAVEDEVIVETTVESVVEEVVAEAQPVAEASE